MKYYTKLKVYKSSNNLFNPNSLEAISYNWWKYLSVVNRKIVFNNYRYSVSTSKHQRETASLLRQLGIKIDLFVESSHGLQNSNWKHEVLEKQYYTIFSAEHKLANPVKGMRKDTIETLKNDIVRAKSNIKEITKVVKFKLHADGLKQLKMNAIQSHNLQLEYKAMQKEKALEQKRIELERANKIDLNSYMNQL